MSNKFIEHIVLKYLVVPKAPVVDQEKIHIACIGDSITFGAGVNGVKEKTWEYKLNQMLGEGYQVLNYGISARTLQDEADYPYTAEKFYKKSHDVLADIYIIMLGTNDAKTYNWDKDRYTKELNTFVRSYIELPNKPKVILMTPPKCYVAPEIGKVNFDIDADVVDGQIHDIVQATANELSLDVIDLNEFTACHEEWFCDGVHPNEAGNAAIAEFIRKNLKIELV